MKKRFTLIVILLFAVCVDLPAQDSDLKKELDLKTKGLKKVIEAEAELEETRIRVRGAQDGTGSGIIRQQVAAEKAAIEGAIAAIDAAKRPAELQRMKYELEQRKKNQPLLAEEAAKKAKAAYDANPK